MARRLNARFLKYMVPLVESLRELGNSARPKQVVKAIEQRAKVPEGDLERRTKSGQSIFENDVHWCRSYLAKTGYIDSSKRGVWTLTPAGRDLKMTQEAVARIFRSVQADRGQSDAEEDDVDIEDVVQVEKVLDYRFAVLEKLKKLTPAGFEEFCRRLLLEAGFEEVEVTGRPGDRGVDGRGVLRVNPLFSLKIAFQAKRYQGNVGPATVRDFRGAIAGRADRGLLISTGTFTSESEIEASRDGATQIELVDGDALIRLMEQYEFGLRPFPTFLVDDSVFQSFGT